MPSDFALLLKHMRACPTAQAWADGRELAECITDLPLEHTLSWPHWFMHTLYGYEGVMNASKLYRDFKAMAREAYQEMGRAQNELIVKHGVGAAFISDGWHQTVEVLRERTRTWMVEHIDEISVAVNEACCWLNIGTRV